MKFFSTTPLKAQHRKQSNDSKYKQKANVQSPPFKRKMADVLLLDPGHGLLVTVIKESPKSSNAQQILFALLFSSNQMSNIKTKQIFGLIWNSLGKRWISGHVKYMAGVFYEVSISWVKKLILFLGWTLQHCNSLYTNFYLTSGQSLNPLGGKRPENF